MFNLDHEIKEWRRKLIAGGIKSSHVLDELESHLREDVERRLRSGTPAQQAFEDSVQQVGSVDELKSEFGKIEPQRAAVSPKLMSRGCVAMGVFMVFTGMWLLSDAPIEERLWGSVWLMLIGAYIAVLPRLNRKVWSGVRGWAFRKAVITACNFIATPVIAVLLLDYMDVIHIPIIQTSMRFQGVIFWPVFTAVAATSIVLSHATDWKGLGLWSPAAEKSFEIAEAEALNFHHNFVGTEHLLLGLLGTERSPIPGVLAKMGVSGETVRAEIEKIVCSFAQSPSAKTRPCTPRARKALRLALREAKAMRRDCVDSEHVFLGLIREGSGVAALVLKNLGVNVNNAREEILRTCR